MIPDILPGDVVLIGYRAPEWAHGTYMTVEEVRTWGVKGAVQGPHQQSYPMRLSFNEIEAVFRKVEVKQ